MDGEWNPTFTWPNTASASKLAATTITLRSDSTLVPLEGVVLFLGATK